MFMRIALMTNNYKPVMGGVPISIERLAKGLRELGHEVTVFAPSYKGEEPEDGVFRYKTLIKKFYGGSVLPNALDPAIEREFRQHRYDVIHVHHPVVIGNTALYLSKKYNIPLTFTYHTRYEHYLSYAGIIRGLEKRSNEDNIVGMFSEKLIRDINTKIVPSYIASFAKKCDCIFAPTPGMKDYLIYACEIPKDKVRVLPTGLEKSEYKEEQKRVAEIRRKYIKNGEFLFVSVSRIAKEKNIDFLIEVAKRLKRKTTMPFKLLMVGDGPKRTEYEKACKQAGLQEIDFIGQISNDEIKNYCGAADAFVFASKSETQGIVIIESLAVGTPVIAVDATGVRDVVKDGVNGILTDENVDDFVNELYSYMRGEMNIDAFSKNAYDTAVRYSEVNIAKSALKTYREVIEKYPA